MVGSPTNRSGWSARRPPPSATRDPPASAIRPHRKSPLATASPYPLPSPPVLSRTESRLPLKTRDEDSDEFGPDTCACPTPEAPRSPAAIDMRESLDVRKDVRRQGATNEAESLG